MPKYVRKLILIAVVVLVPLILLSIFSGRILEWLWLQELGYTQVFWTVRSTQFMLLIGAFLIAGIYLVLNFRFLASQLRYATFTSTPLQNLNVTLSIDQLHRLLRRYLSLGALVIALLFAISFVVRWDIALRFIGSVPFGETDPLFGHDIGFYLFELPFWQMLQGSLATLAFLTLAMLAGAYFLTGMVGFSRQYGIQAYPAVLQQLQINTGLWLLLIGWGVYLDRYQLLFRSDGLIFGAGYTHVNIELPALWILTVLVVLLAVAVMAGRWIRINRLVGGLAIGAVLTLILGRAIIPAAVQQFSVEPNELELETPFIENNIAMTRLAYGLNDIREVNYQADDTLTLADIRSNQDAIDNIRLWDPRLLIQTYRQLQEIRPYYRFNAVDIDRYDLNGNVQQMMLAGRELAARLPQQSDTWVNRHMQFTHGFGLAMSPVTAANTQGEPLLYLRDIPPVTAHEALRVDNPAIYYGEHTLNYYIVNTGTPELHYPQGDENVYIHYDGSGGIAFSSWLRKLLFAWELGDLNILLSDYIHSESRLQIWRGVQDRIRRITPFLELDEDPYLVLHDGRLVWIQDAYTTSSHFPYAQRYGSINYIRNSVKIVVDAYEGSVDYYVVDEEDPVLQMYDSIFPGLFKSLDELPDGLQAHFRYPQNLFEAQLELYSRYHMVRPRVFYNNEDRWTRPLEQYGGRRQLMEPYYVLARLPDEESLQFMLISPLTPEGRSNMIGWMAAKSDPDSYGEVVAYHLPKDRLIYGPAQIEARIDQDTEISRQLALWDQRGSRVIRGNLMVIPIEDSFLYVEPVFLLAEDGDIPQLQRVIVAIGDHIAMQPTLESALLDVFGRDAYEALPPLLAGAPVAEGVAMSDGEVPVRDARLEEMEEVRMVWRQLNEARRDGNWSRYGELLDRMDDLVSGWE